MKQTVFKKVYTKDRLPNEGWYNTDKGIEYYSEKLEEWASSMYKSKPEWWLEEVELPNQEELYDEICQIPDLFDMSTLEASNTAANYILNKLK